MEVDGRTILGAAQLVSEETAWRIVNALLYRDHANVAYRPRHSVWSEEEIVALIRKGG